MIPTPVPGPGPSRPEISPGAFLRMGGSCTQGKAPPDCSRRARERREGSATDNDGKLTCLPLGRHPNPLGSTANLGPDRREQFLCESGRPGTKHIRVRIAGGRARTTKAANERETAPLLQRRACAQQALAVVHPAGGLANVLPCLRLAARSLNSIQLRGAGANTKLRRRKGTLPRNNKSERLE